MQTKLIRDFGCVHGILWWTQLAKAQFGRAGFSTYREILFVGKDKEQCVSQFILVQHTLQFLTSFDNTIAIIAVNDENDALSVLEVMSPKRSDLVLTTDIPDSELDVLIVDSLDVKAYTDSLFSTVPDASGIVNAPIVGIVVTISPSFSL
jgi:hypothetical protein